MNIRKLGTVVLLASAFGFATAEDAKALIQKHAAGFDRAMKTKDLKWFDSVATPDYHEINAQGKRWDRKTALAMMKQMFQAGSVDTISTKVLNAKQSGNTIIATCESRMTGKMKFSPKAKRPSDVKGSMRYTETWKKGSHGWKLQELKTLKETMLVDGKPMPMG